MQSRINFFFILICFAALASVGFTGQTAVLPPASVSAGEAGTLPFPYIAEIAADDLYIRSGPGTNYYACGKLNKADRVKVVGSQFSWSRIVPPAGSFSWISMQYVSIDPDNPTVGIVTGNSVRVYVGSDERKPMHSTIEQLKLDRGDKVKLMGEGTDDYYKIASPTGAYLWVLTRYTNPLGPVGEVPLIVEPPPSEAQADTGVVVATSISVEAKKLKEYYTLKKQVDAERVKPIARQNYTNIKKAILEIAGNRRAGKATRYSQFAVKQIERFELALAVAKEVQLQDAQLQETRERIDRARARRLAEVKDLGRFSVIGWFKTSSIYGLEPELKHYQVIDRSGKIICFALPSGSALKMDLSEFMGRRVGLTGTIEPYPQTASALVRFTEIVEQKSLLHK